MPTYDYVCQACDHAFEEFQSITAKPLRKCPECAKPKLKRLIGTGAGVIFKGGGFYETDYRSDSYQKAAKADKDAASGKSESSSSEKSGDKPAKSESAASKSDSKPAASSETKSAGKAKPSKKD